MMDATITTAPWLGTRKRNWGHEQFPEGTLNEAQIRTLFNIEERGQRVIELDLPPAILKLSDEIVEVRTRFGNPRNRFAAEVTYLWLNTDGKLLSALVEKYEGPPGVHPPGAKYRKWAVGYLRTPQMTGRDHAVEVEYEYMWGIGGDGAVDQVRQHIRDNWIDNNDDKE
jgi:hypothetical protein